MILFGIVAVGMLASLIGAVIAVSQIGRYQE